MTNKIFINASSFAADVSGLEKYFALKDLRRMDVFTKLALKAAVKCLQNAGINLKEEKNIALIITTGYGPVGRTCDFMDSIIDDGDECASPLAFSSSVHNAALTSVSILLNIKGPCLTVSNLESSFKSGVQAAKTWLNSGMADKVLLGAVDEKHSVAEGILKTTPEVFADFKNTEPRAGAAFFLLSKKGETEMSEIKTTASPLNPSEDAFALAEDVSEILNYADIERIASDYIKTELARYGADIMSVFETADAASLLPHAEPPLQKKITRGLRCLLSGVNEEVNEVPADIVKDAWETFKKYQVINFFTSGSTGIVKNCLQTPEIIKEEAHGLSFLFKDIKRIVYTVPVSHSYGFIFGLQMPKVINVPFEIKPPLPVLPWENILREGDLFVSFPMFLKQLSAQGFKFPPGITVLTSTAPCPDELIDALYASGVKRLIEIYGASESGAIGWREKGGQPFTLAPFWEAGIKNKKLETIVRKKTFLKIDIPDIVEVLPDGRFRPAGRKDNAVQVAGINVFPQKVESILKTHPRVAEAAVRLMRPDEGERLKTFIVLKPGVSEETALAELRKFMKENLTAHETPRKITFGVKIPVTDFGKKKDW